MSNAQGTSQGMLMPRMEELATFLEQANLFNPYLFGEFWDPAEPFDLWDLDPSENQLSDSVIWSETDRDLSITADFPGLKKEDLQLIVEDGTVLEITGGCNTELGFIRKFNLPTNVDVDEIEASMKDGIFHICIPKSSAAAQPSATSAQVKIIDIKV